MMQHLDLAIDALAPAQRVDDPTKVVVAEPVQLLPHLAWRSGA